MSAKRHNFSAIADSSGSSGSQASSSASQADSSVDSRASSASQHHSNFVSLSSQSTDSNLVNASNAVANADQYYHQIDSISDRVIKNSASVQSLSILIRQLSSQIAPSMSIATNLDPINAAAQNVAINIIRINSHKIKALVAKSKVGDVASKTHRDYQSYNHAKATVKKDVSEINRNMASQNNSVMNEAIATLNSDNALVTSYAYKLSADVSQATNNVASASSATSDALLNQSNASSACEKAASVANGVQKRVVSAVSSNAAVTSSVAAQVGVWQKKTVHFNQMMSQMNQQYSANSVIASASNLIQSDLQTIIANNHLVSNAATTAITQASRVNYKGLINRSDVGSLGDHVQTVSQAASKATSNEQVVVSAMNHASSAAAAAKSVAATLAEKRSALEDGAKGYVPGRMMNSSVLLDRPKSYVKNYHQGYFSSRRGFLDHVHETVTNADHDSGGILPYRVGFKNASRFIRGVNDARRRIIKDDELIDNRHYNVGYDTYRQLVRKRMKLGQDQHDQEIAKNHPLVSLNEGILLVMGFLVGAAD